MTRPSTSNSAQERSCTSLMTVERAVRIRVVAMSSATVSSAYRIT